MAKTKETETTAEVAETKTQANARQGDEITYTFDEIVAASKAFGAQPEIVRAALLRAKVTCATKAQAQRIIDDFKKKKVKSYGHFLYFGREESKGWCVPAL